MTIPRNQAETIARQVIEKLTPECKLIKVCGSIRRNATNVKDIDLVCLPIIDQIVVSVDMFTSKPVLKRYKNRLLQLLHDRKRMDVLGLELMSGKDKKISIRLVDEEANVELYLVDRDSQYGLAVLVRTGPALVTKRIMQYALERHWHITDYELHTHEKGGKPGHRTKCKRGGDCTAVADTSTETKAFAALGLDYPHPAARVPYLIEKLIAGANDKRITNHLIMNGGGGGAYG